MLKIEKRHGKLRYGKWEEKPEVKKEKKEKSIWKNRMISEGGYLPLKPNAKST